MLAEGDLEAESERFQPSTAASFGRWRPCGRSRRGSSWACSSAKQFVRGQPGDHRVHPDGGEIDVIVTGINVGAQPYWNAEATMVMHTKGIPVMTPGGAPRGRSVTGHTVGYPVTNVRGYTSKPAGPLRFETRTS